VETEYHRAAPGGTGGTKCVGNYSPVLKTQLAAKAVGFSDVVYLDAKENKYIEEVSSCNIFVVKGKRISTPALGCASPPLPCAPCAPVGRAARLAGLTCAGARLFPDHASGTILPGITRKSIIELAKQQGYEVQERAVAVEEVLDADELFCTVRALLAVPSSRARRAWRALSLARAQALTPPRRFRAGHGGGGRSRRQCHVQGAQDRLSGPPRREAHARARGAFQPG
jgi:branched-chain amino acid aminotransferase